MQKFENMSEIWELLEPNFQKEVNKLVPKNIEELKELFQEQNESEIKLLKGEMKILLRLMHPEISWNKNTGNVVVKNFGEIKGTNILKLFRDFIQLDFLNAEIRSIKDILFERLIKLIEIQKGISLEVFSF